MLSPHGCYIYSSKSVSGSSKSFEIKRNPPAKQSKGKTWFPFHRAGCFLCRVFKNSIYSVTSICSSGRRESNSSCADISPIILISPIFRFVQFIKLAIMNQHNCRRKYESPAGSILPGRAFNWIFGIGNRYVDSRR